MTTLAISQYECRGLRFYVRPDTTDAKAIEEVVGRHAYLRRGFLEIDPGDHWLDLGGNIGAFAISAAATGAEVRTFEPEPQNYELLVRNLALNGLTAGAAQAAVVESGPKKQALWLCKSPRNKYRHTLQPKKGWQGIWVDCLTLDSVLADGWTTAIKLDIEGAELDMLSSPRAWTGITKMVFEYHFDYDRLLSHFYERVALLRNVGFEVHHAKMPVGPTYDYWPSATIVHARRA